MAKRFDQLGQKDAFDLIRTPALFEEAHDFVYVGDHWRSGGGFVGPTTSAERTAAEQNAVRTGWQRRFNSENILREIVKRACDAVVGKEPQWSAELARPLTDAEEADADEIPPEERARLEEAGAAMAEWWDTPHGILTEYNAAGQADDGNRRRVPVHKALKAFAFAVKTFGRAGLRIRMPAARRRPDGTFGTADPRAALRHIFLEVVLPDAGRLYMDPETMYDLGIVAYEDEDEVDVSETVKYAELSYLLVDLPALSEAEEATSSSGAASDTVAAVQRGAPLYGQAEGEPLTVLRITYQDAAEDFTQTFDLRGNLLFYEASHEALVTAQMLELQKAYNTEATELAIVLDQEGFPEVILTNTLGPGTWETDAQTGKPKFVPIAYGRGPGKRAFMMGEPTSDPATGEPRGYTSPGVHQIEAADVEGYLKTLNARRLAMLRQARQLWTETTDDATASGESRVQALVDFLQDAADFKATMDAALKWALETVWSMALDLAGQPGRDHDLRFVADCKLTLPFIPAAMREAILKEVEKGVRSLETAMSDLGIEDVQAELQRIAEGEQYRLQKRQKQAEIMANARAAGAAIEGAAAFAMVPEGDERNDLLEGAEAERLQSSSARARVMELTRRPPNQSAPGQVA